MPNNILSLEELEKKLGLCFMDKGLLQAALTSRSYSKEIRDKNPDTRVMDNERLEFLGDAVIELVAREYLYKNLDGPESVLTCKKKDYVDDSHLYSKAIELGLKPYLRLGIGESRNIQSEEAILSGTLEALCAAIYLDEGLEITKKFILKSIIL